MSLIMCFGFTSCEDVKDAKDAKDAKNTLIIKNFHLGMEYISAKELIKKYINGSSLEKASRFQVREKGFDLIAPMTDDEMKLAKGLADFTGRELSNRESHKKIAEFNVDDQGRVKYFKISSDLSKILFNSGDLKNEEFAQMFVDE